MDAVYARSDKVSDIRSIFPFFLLAAKIFMASTVASHYILTQMVMKISAITEKIIYYYSIIKVKFCACNIGGRCYNLQVTQMLMLK